MVHFDGGDGVLYIQYLVVTLVVMAELQTIVVMVQLQWAGVGAVAVRQQNCGAAELWKYPQKMGVTRVRVIGGKLRFLRCRKDSCKVRGDLLLLYS